MVFDFDKCSSIIFEGIKIKKDGIPSMVGLPKLGYYTYPVTVSLYGIYQKQLYEKTGDFNNLEASKKCARWLEDKVTFKNEDALWLHDFKLDFPDIEPPWICGLTQSLAAWLLFSLKKFGKNREEISYRALNPFFKKVEEGGLMNNINGYKFFEEYPSSPPSATLNGHIYTLLVFHAFLESKYEKVREIFKDTVSSLAKNLYRYDTGYWTLYDLWKIERLSSLQYHWLHTYQAALLYKITGIKEFNNYHKKWRSYWDSNNSRFFRIINKIVEKINLKIKKQRR